MDATKPSRALRAHSFEDEDMAHDHSVSPPAGATNPGVGAHHKPSAAKAPHCEDERKDRKDSVSVRPRIAHTPFDIACAKDVNRRRHMEDRVYYRRDVLAHMLAETELGPQLAGVERITAFGVMDGHAGTGAVEFVNKEFLNQFLTNCKSFMTQPMPLSVGPPGGSFSSDSDVWSDDDSPTPKVPLQEVVQTALVETMRCLDARFCCKASKRRDRSGACVCMCLLVDHKLFVCNVGDCRAVVVRHGYHATALSEDHKPDRYDESTRILRAGGSVQHSNGEFRVMPHGIGVSRSIGDYMAKEDYTRPAARPRLLIPDPEVTVTDVTPDMYWLIVASDGVWGKLSNQHVADATRGKRDAKAACSAIVAAAKRAGSIDNISLIALRLGSV